MPTVTNKSKSISRFAEVASELELQNAKEVLEAKGFTVLVVEQLRDARSAVEKIIPAGSEVFTGTSVTLTESGLDQVLNTDKYVSVRKKFMPLYGQKGKEVEMRRIGSGADYAVGSVHAITEDGQVIIASASGSQLPSYAYGASHVIWVVGTQKIVKDLNEAFERLETYTFPLENERAMKAYGRGSSISKILIYRHDPTHRATVVLVKQAVGF